MLVYTVDQGRYISMADSLCRQPEGKRSLYVNLTNRCSCACTFCLRQFKEMARSSSLWLDEEPSAAEVQAALQPIPWDFVGEVVFCGFGEPTMRLAVLIELLGWIRQTHPGVRTRLNTNGLSDLVYGRDTAVDFAGGLLDTISISLNASNEARYLELTRSSFGQGSFAAMLSFAVRCKAYVPDVVLTVVDHVEDDGEIAACQKICDARGLRLRVRPYEAN